MWMFVHIGIPVALSAALYSATVFAQGAPAPAAGGGGGDGQQVFNNHCRTCHSLKEGDNRQGPNLAGIVGKKSGSVQGVSYSSALKDGAITWDEGALDKWIENPDSVAAGNNMKPYGGVQNPEDRKKIIEYLKSGK